MICAEKESRELSCEIKRRAYPTHLNPPLRVLMAFLQLGVFFKTVLATVTSWGFEFDGAQSDMQGRGEVLHNRHTSVMQ